MGERYYGSEYIQRMAEALKKQGKLPSQIKARKEAEAREKMADLFLQPSDPYNPTDSDEALKLLEEQVNKLRTYKDVSLFLTSLAIGSEQAEQDIKTLQHVIFSLYLRTRGTPKQQKALEIIQRLQSQP